MVTMMVTMEMVVVVRELQFLRLWADFDDGDDDYGDDKDNKKDKNEKDEKDDKDDIVWTFRCPPASMTSLWSDLPSVQKRPMRRTLVGLLIFSFYDFSIADAALQVMNKLICFPQWRSFCANEKDIGQFS